MTEIHTGSCLCGGVAYQITGEMRHVVECHCIQCRKTSGHFVAATQVGLDQLTLTQEESLRWYVSSATAKRGFCSVCGGSVFWQPNEGGRISIMAGTLDAPTGLHIGRHIFSEFAGDYYDIASKD